ncbi:hypothetical protein B932_3270 [Gluconobacter oxydans H24]|nr:hypothetical protein B932_3270 [Gluconobacter oxydans H24]
MLQPRADWTCWCTEISIEALAEAHCLVETGRMQGKVALQSF